LPKTQKYNLELTDKKHFVKVSGRNPQSRALKCDLGMMGTVGLPHQTAPRNHRWHNSTLLRL